MKKLIAIIVLFPMFANAQKLIGGKNIIKTNLFGDAIGNFNVTYERSLLKKMSLSIGFRYMPKSSVPFKDQLAKLIDDPNVNVNDFKLGNFAITPELRLYLSAGKMKGFYIAPYGRYASFDLTVPITYNYKDGLIDKKAEVLFDGKINSFSGGILLGTQFQIAKKIVLDFWIVGGHYGSSSGTIYATDFKPPITSQSQADALQAQLNDLKEVGPFTFEGKVSGASDNWKTVTITSTGPWAGVRALGLSLGIRL